MSSAPRIAPVVFGGLLPHPPITLPAVGGERGVECRVTTEACRALARRLVSTQPNHLLLISPHAPRSEGGFGLWSAERLTGNLAAFGFREIALELPGDAELCAAVERAAVGEGVTTELVFDVPLDHGAVVPLLFLLEAGWTGPTCVVSTPARTESTELAAFGRALSRAATELASPTALIASGDLSHRVTHGAPGGYHERAIEFDRRLCEELECGRLERIAELDPALRELASEDVVESCAVVIAALPEPRHGTELLSYEHPFGVGYLVAVFHEEPGAAVAP